MCLESVQEHQTHLGQEQEFQKEMNRERVPESRTRMHQGRVLRSLQKETPLVQELVCSRKVRLQEQVLACYRRLSLQERGREAIQRALP